MTMDQYYGTGRRKCSVARVYLRPNGSGKVVINHESPEKYFGREVLRMIMQQPLVLVAAAKDLDILVNVQGGGLSGQAGAIRLGIARALVKWDEGHHTPLKHAGMLTRDSRIVERKKYGQPGARKRFQYSKR